MKSSIGDLVPLAIRSVVALVVATILLFVAPASSQNQLQVGYAVIAAENGQRPPVAAALFSFRNAQDILVAEAGVEAVGTLTRSRIFVDLDGTHTGVALANPANRPVTADVVLRDAAGITVEQTDLTLGPGEHLPRFVDDPELFPDTPRGFTGSLTFTTRPGDPGLAAVTLRQGKNAHGEPLLATLPVVDLSAQETPAILAPADSIVFPHIGAGVGGASILSTQFILINPWATSVTGEIRLTTSEGEPLEGELEGVKGSEFDYELQPHGTYRATLRSGAGLLQGYAVVTVEEGPAPPAGTAIFQFRDGLGRLVSEASVGAVLPTVRARLFVDTVGTLTGVALAVPGDRSAPVTFELLDRNGLWLDSVQRQLPARGHLSHFVSDLFTDLPPGFTGLLEIRSEVPFVPVTLKLTTNRRNDLILTTLPLADLSRLREPTTLVLPQVGFGLGFSTRLVLINTDEQSRLVGNIFFFDSNGSEMVVVVLGEPSNEVGYAVQAGGALQVRPGNLATVAEIRPTASTFLPTEVVVNLGNTLVMRPLVVDTSGEPRDDFPLEFHSIDPDVASVDPLGRITPHRVGFSTLTISAAGIIVSPVITVVEVTSGAEGFAITGIAEDLGGRFYLADSRDHAIRLAEGLKDVPKVYAGTERNRGFRNDTRLNSLFDRPAFLALNQADGSLYVTDSGNNVIRRVLPGPGGRVETLAGTGAIGSLDGEIDEATFNNPQGLALDEQGNLWVADSGNHIIRRFSLTSKTVKTIAGKAAVAGLVDGVGEEARFDSPMGIAVEFEPLARRVVREVTGEPPPPVSIIVADTGNGAIRRVREDGLVETLSGPGSASSEREASSLSRRPFKIPAAGPVPDSPVGVAVDSSGNIFVSYQAAGQVRTILRTGDEVASAQEGSFDQPAGVITTDSGGVVVADQSRTSQEIVFGAPEIQEISPPSVGTLGGKRITIEGRNFASDTLVVAAGVPVPEVLIESTRSLSFLAPDLPSGLVTVTLQHRGGLAQASLLVEPVPLQDLPDGHITTVAGGTTFSGDGSLAIEASIGFPTSTALDANGNLYVVDQENHRIRRIDAQTGVITSVAGSGQAGFSGDGGLAVAADLFFPSGVAVGPAGQLFIADSQNQRIRVVTEGGIIRTLAGVGQFGFFGDGGPAAEAAISSAVDVAPGAAGDLLIADTYNNRIRRVDLASGIITTVAGNGEGGFSGDEGPAIEASLLSPWGVHVGQAGDIYIADRFNNRIRKVEAATGLITTVAGTGEYAFSGDGGPALEAALSHPADVATDGNGNLFIADRDNFRVRKLDVVTGLISTVAGGAGAGFAGDGGPATEARLRRPEGLALDGSGNLYIADTLNRRIRKVDGTDHIIRTMAGKGDIGFAGDGGPATEAILQKPEGVAADPAGGFYIADTFHHRVHYVEIGTGVIRTVAGNGESGYRGDGLPATETSLSQPVGIAVGPNGNLYIADRDNNRIRRVEAGTGMISTVAGNGANAFSGDHGPAVDASIGRPEGVAVDEGGHLYIADTFNSRIRRVDMTLGIITTVAGIGTPGFSGDGGPAVNAALYGPSDVALDSRGDLFLCDRVNNRIRRVDLTTGIISTVAGGAQGGFEGDGGPAKSAALASPGGIAFDSEDNLYIADSRNHRIRVVVAGSGIIRTIAGTGDSGATGDGREAAEATLNFPRSVALDVAGNLLIADFLNHRVRAVGQPRP